MTLPGAHVVWLEWLPQAVGGLFFTLAASIEFRDVLHVGETWRYRVFWVCFFYLLGSLLFWLAASTGLYTAWADVEDEVLARFGVDLPYLVGSACFLVGAWLQLQMWHAEQFGLNFIREINMQFHEKAQPIPPDQELFLAVYALNGALSAINICLSLVWHRQEAVFSHMSRGEHLLAETEEILSDGVAFVASHAMLLLATAASSTSSKGGRTPDLEPYGYLIKVMRTLAVLQLAASLMRCAKYMDETISCR